jgi:hypothetical protein
MAPDSDSCTKPFVPSIDEQIEVIRGTIESLSRSHTDYFGLNEGTIADPEAVRCIKCLEATLAILRSHQPPRQ